MSTFSSFITDQWTTLPILATTEDCTGKTYVITGANTGLGYELAKHLVSLSAAHVFLGVRSLAKGAEAKARIELETGRKDVVEVWRLDLSIYDSVKQFSEKIKNLDRVDALVENAGVALPEWYSSEGLEITLTVNVISTMLLAALVLPSFQQMAKKYNTSPRIVIVGSEIAFHAKGELEKIEDYDLLEGLNKGVMGNRYPISKLLLLYAVREFCLLNPVSKTGVTTNYLNPGLCRTELSRNSSLGFRISIRIMWAVLGRTAEEGSRTESQAVVADATSHGKYLATCEIRENQVEDWVVNTAGKKMQKRVCDSISKRLKAIEPGCV